MARRRKRSCFGCLFRLIFYALIIGILALLAIYWLPMSIPSGSQEMREELSVNENLSGDWMNILLLGSDSGDPDSPGRTDTMIIASINKNSGDVKLISLLRDTWVDIPGYGQNKLNAAYRFGGAKLLMRTVNEAFETNITEYITLDFTSFPFLIDSLGGIYLTVKEEELPILNRLVLSVRHLFQDTNLDTSELAAAGENVRLTGLQALAFSRMRSLDSDYQRASRQRKVLDAVLSKARQIRNPVTMYQMANTLISYADTNIPAMQLSLIGTKILVGGADMEQFQIPAPGAFTEVSGSTWYIKPDIEKNRRLLREIIYGE